MFRQKAHDPIYCGIFNKTHLLSMVVPHAWEGHIPLGGQGYQPQNHMPGVWGVDSHCWGLGGGFPVLVPGGWIPVLSPAWEGHIPLGRVTSRTTTQHLPGKAISPWEGLPATNHMPGVWGGGFPFLVPGRRVPAVPVSSLTLPFGCPGSFSAPRVLSCLASGLVLPGFWVDADYRHMVSDLRSPINQSRG